MRHSWQLLQAARYLHYHNIGHRDISLENALIKDNHLKLMDFGQACQLHAQDAARTALRYFRAAGKNYYRAPEMYVPKKQIQALCPPSCAGRMMQVRAGGYCCEVAFPADAVEGNPCLCDPVGYTVAPADLFAIGVCIFVLHTQNPPWKMAILSDQLFSYIGQHGVARLWAAWRKPLLPEPAMILLQGLIEVNPANRLSLEAALGSEWYPAMGDGPDLGDPAAPLPAPPPVPAPAPSPDASSSASNGTASASGAPSAAGDPRCAER